MQSSPRAPVAASPRSPHPFSPSTPVSVAHHRLRAQPTPSLPNLRAGPSRTPHTHHTADRMPHDPSPTSPSSSLVPSAQSANDLQKHLYISFLERKTADVSLRVHGSWRATYKLHRVVLIQAGFFKSLFTAGFVESMTKAGSSHQESEVIDIVFDDPNITRAAFEICIARLYGGGPPIHISPTLIPTPLHPLTPTQPFSSATDAIPDSTCPPTSHPTTPRFLLSLLATAVFLSIPTVAAQTLSAVLTTIGPRTVLRYLGFAIGHGIGDPDEEEPEAAVGLEGIAIMTVDSESDSRKASSSSFGEDHKSSDISQDSHSAEESHNDASSSSDHAEIKKEDPANSLSDSSYADSNSSSHNASAHFFYGGVSNKIGEAAVCWITRWGGDMLRYEEECMGPNFTRIRQDFLAASGSTSPSNTRKRATTIPFHSNAPINRPSAGPSVGPIVETASESAHLMPLVWRRGGLDAQWVRRLLSSDALFVKGEKERYNMARAIVELRRKDGILKEEEEEWKVLFERGIYYANMHLDELVFITKDISPTTGKPYVPLFAVQSAHWDQSMLHHHISARPSTSSNPPLSPSSRPKEVGFTIQTADLNEAQSGAGGLTAQPGEQKLYFPVPEDSSTRLGDSSGLEGASMDQLFDLSPMRKSTGTGTFVHTSETNCFGLDQQAFTPPSCRSQDPKGKGRWTPYPPLRFGVEFWDIDALKEKSRLHSHTVWYAGSLWNVYVQIVRKKGVQLGVYLHRQSSVDPIPPSSAPLPSSVPIVAVPQPQHSPAPARPISPPSRSSTPYTPISPSRPSSLPSSYSSVHVNSGGTANTIPATAPPVTPPQPYRDPRSAVSAYFTIACASATGGNLTKFTSAPDVFSVSQSWGWKSSSLRTEEYLEISEDGVMKSNVTSGKEVSLRATIVLGVI
ncbi:hypothetical protein EIP91_000973 [Steccherinum ochraceum]|uniref:BTB domain-containing protein n=1 Tax=Steccherinum ochraceum TaxID=92696 RepID=A0A4R0RI45_9APHY|nr:hypothetical protein EIP91_000973 [Steccherinum ochraceum]